MPESSVVLVVPCASAVMTGEQPTAHPAVVSPSLVRGQGVIVETFSDSRAHNVRGFWQHVCTVPPLSCGMWMSSFPGVCRIAHLNCTLPALLFVLDCFIYTVFPLHFLVVPCSVHLYQELHPCLDISSIVAPSCTAATLLQLNLSLVVLAASTFSVAACIRRSTSSTGTTAHSLSSCNVPRTSSRASSNASTSISSGHHFLWSYQRFQCFLNISLLSVCFVTPRLCDQYLYCSDSTNQSFA